ncbi:MAG TPA: hypothetical protein PLN42_00240 [Anaerolineae bacterium]|nr:hypothetical protein [Anaerolineae bacterium]
MATQTTLGEAAVPIRAALDKLDQDLAQAKSKVSSAIDGIVGNVQKVGAAAMAGVGVVGGAAAAAAAALSKIAIDAAPVEGLRDAFEGLAESSGSSMDEMLAALQRGSSGMVSQRDLMSTYNQAAQLVSTTFANQLPDAMGYLSKVSAATGQDMGFMLDSLVKGVGRLSPMILDNLGIQVNLSEATERAAAMFGVEADALDKGQIQAGMMNVVLEKLAANTAAMPDVSDSAAAGLARMKAQVQDIKDRVGVALLPVLNTLLTMLAGFLPYLEPIIQAFETHLVPILQTVATAFGTFFTSLLEGTPPLDALGQLLATLLPPDVAAGITTALGNIVSFVQQLVDKVQPYIDMAMQWISENVELQDVLIALGIAIGAVVVPALVSVVAAAAPVIAVGAALIAAVALVRSAWESDFAGIRTFIENALATIKQWWTAHGEEVIARAREIYETVKSGIETAIAAIKAVVNLALGAIKQWWSEHGEQIMAAARAAWETIRAIVDVVINNVKDIIAAVSLAIQGDWHGFGEKLREIWDRTWELIKEILGRAWEAIKGIVGNIIDSVISFFRDTDWGAVGRGIIEGIANGIRNGIGAIVDAARAAAQAALDAALGFLGIHSPSTVFEVQVAGRSIEGWVRGLESGIARIRSASAKLAEASVSEASASATASLPGDRGWGGIIIHNHFGPDSVRSEADIYRLAEAIQASLDLRTIPRFVT